MHKKGSTNWYYNYFKLYLFIDWCTSISRYVFWVQFQICICSISN